MNPVKTGFGKSPALVKRITIILSVLFGLTLLLIAGSAVGFTIAGKAAISETEELNRRIKDLNTTLDRSKKMALRTPTERSQAKLQALIQETGEVYGCRIREFQVAPDSQPFLSKFETKAESKGWVQNAAQINLEGSNGAIFRIVSAIHEGPTPVEFDAIEIAASPNASHGQLVSAKLTFRILSMEVKK